MELDELAFIIEETTRRIGSRFRTFGGGHVSPNNIMSIALKYKPLQFAAGVDVSDVVRFVFNDLTDVLVAYKEGR